MNPNQFFVFKMTFQQVSASDKFTDILLILSAIILFMSIMLSMAFVAYKIDNNDLSDLDNGIIFLVLFFLIAIIAKSSYVVNCLITKSELITKQVWNFAISASVIGLTIGCAGALILIVILITNCKDWINDTVGLKLKLIKAQRFINQNKTNIKQIINQFWPVANYVININDYTELDSDNYHDSDSLIACQIIILMRNKPLAKTVINWTINSYQDITKCQSYQKVFQFNQHIATRYYLLNKTYPIVIYRLANCYQRVVINETISFDLSAIF